MSSEMEPEIKRFLLKIVRGISVTLLWLLMNILLGLWLQWAFVYDHLNVFNILYYLWVLLSLPALIYYIVRLWKS
jgi:hypothetical protein